MYLTQVGDEKLMKAKLHLHRDIDTHRAACLTMFPTKDPVSFLFILASVPVSYSGQYCHLTDRSQVKRDTRELIDLLLARIEE